MAQGFPGLREYTILPSCSDSFTESGRIYDDKTVPSLLALFREELLPDLRCNVHKQKKGCGAQINLEAFLDDAENVIICTN